MRTKNEHNFQNYYFVIFYLFIDYSFIYLFSAVKFKQCRVFQFLSAMPWLRVSTAEARIRH